MQREGHRHFARIDALLQFREAADAADEIDALVAAQVGDAEQRAEYVVRQQRDIEAIDRVDWARAPA
jgi:hypothetical protein